MGNIITKRTAMLVGLSLVAVGFLRSYAKKPENKDSVITKFVQTINLDA